MISLQTQDLICHMTRLFPEHKASSVNVTLSSFPAKELDFVCLEKELCIYCNVTSQINWEKVTRPTLTRASGAAGAWFNMTEWELPPCSLTQTHTPTRTIF